MVQLRTHLSVFLLCYSYAATHIASEVYLYIKPSTASKSPYPTESCLTLEQFSENASQYSDSSASIILEFLPGSHNLQSIISIHNNITHLKCFSRAKNVTIIIYATFELINVTRVELVYLKFDGFGRSLRSPPQLNVTTSNLHLKECKFHRSHEGVIIRAERCIIEIYSYKSEFIDHFSKILEAVTYLTLELLLW